ncbi:TPA: fibronectin binding protein [Streptococcus equi subsp. zooepidemicus]|uniref:TQXA domain-containing protein n=2 Tax=Streptococcus equi TaxID=1336 RepID=UPI0029F70697|nr:fibronectin binding protein [Streptococcus equi subsp. zooepidemicus]HEL0592648.1 fibronectin binding protein [Streptococcus equi subsp. zooepidemicus]HEL0686854.1 fibronectin binding protein [Streptococcus equi subsp. zooepidemicus]HEL0771085.1 fibronectin binding protein [Streptococcus equi subsp. zooepidemicus]HEL0776515.1 fibronectin binding protein [Streptococcus equi subsp. zooepidemicus]
MERLMRTQLKKLLAGTAAGTLLLFNLTCGMINAFAEQYYGWSDGSSSYPSALYVTPVGDTTKKIAIPVYCFDYKFQEPLAWKETTQPSHLIVYDKYDDKNLMAALVEKPNMVSYETKTKLQTLLKTKSNLITAILSRGYPNKSFFDKYKKLTDEDKRRVTQCALWYHTDNISEQDLITKHLDGDSGEKSQALKELIGVVKNTSNELGEGLTFYTRYNDRYGPKYQNLIGSIIVPEEPQNDLEIGGGNVIDLNYQSGPMVEEGGHSGGKEEVEDTKKPDVIIGGQGSVTETTEDTQKGVSGSTETQPEVEDTKQPQSDIILGGQGNVIDTTENTQEGMGGQSGDTTETEDTKQPQSDIILGGQGNVIDTTENTQEGMSGSNNGQTFEEDTRPKLEFHFDNEVPNDDDAPKPEQPEQPEQPRKPQQEQQSLPRPIEGNQSLPKTHEAKGVLALVGVGILAMLGLGFWFRPYHKD